MRRPSTARFDRYIWSFTGGTTLAGPAPQKSGEVPATTPESDAMSKALRKRGFTFVGSTICYAFMQSTGMVNDHIAGCPPATRWARRWRAATLNAQASTSAKSARIRPRFIRVLWASLVLGVLCAVVGLDAQLGPLARSIAVVAVVGIAVVTVFLIVNLSSYTEFGADGARTRTRAGRDARELFDSTFAYTLSFRNSGRQLFWRFDFGNAPNLRYRLRDRFSDASDRHECYLLGVVERLVWPAAFARLERGEAVDFGTFTLSNRGVVHGNRTAEWSGIARANISFNWISGRSYLEMRHGGRPLPSRKRCPYLELAAVRGHREALSAGIGELKRER